MSIDYVSKKCERFSGQPIKYPPKGGLDDIFGEISAQMLIIQHIYGENQSLADSNNFFFFFQLFIGPIEKE